MRILQINTFYKSGSTGKIVKGIQNSCQENQIECLVGYRYMENRDDEHEPAIGISSWLDCRIHGRLARYTMLKGCFSAFRTIRFLRKAEKFAPDIIHLHNLHGSYINIPLLFRYIKKKNIPIVWTFHDCWPFTGGCAYFDMFGCDQWKNGCTPCSMYKKISSSRFDRSGKIWILKKSWFENVENMIIAAPSEWLAKLVKQSFLKEYPIKVLPNGIDKKIFHPTFGNVREKYGIKEGAFVVLGVAFDWGERKGLDVFIELSKRFNERYQIVLVGNISSDFLPLPSNVIHIQRMDNQNELAEIYTTANVFANPTREDNYPTVNLEALACGTPVVTFQTGGSPECLDASCGSVVKYNDIDSFEKEIRFICEKQPYLSEDCIKKAEAFDESVCFYKYIELYRDIMEKQS